jgi:hypothetical protein
MGNNVTAKEIVYEVLIHSLRYEISSDDSYSKVIVEDSSVKSINCYTISCIGDSGYTILRDSFAVPNRTTRFIVTKKSDTCIVSRTYGVWNNMSAAYKVIMQKES